MSWRTDGKVFRHLFELVDAHWLLEMDYNDYIFTIKMNKSFSFRALAFSLTLSWCLIVFLAQP